MNGGENGFVRVELRAIGGVSVGVSPVGGARMGLSPSGGIEARLVLVLAPDTSEVPAGALCTVDGLPLVTADGYYLIVQFN